MKEDERYFLINKFEDGWGMENPSCEEQLFDYCTNALFVPEENIEELTMTSDGLEIVLKDLELEDINDDWYVSLYKTSKYKGI